VIYLTGSAEEQQRALARIKDMLGADRFRYVIVSTFCDAKAGDVTVLSYDSKASHLGIERVGKTDLDIGFSVHMADILGSKDVVEYRSATSFQARDGSHTTAFLGGAATLSKNESLTGNVQIFVHPNANELAQNRLNSMIGRGKWTGGSQIDFENDIVDAHEFGHAHEGLMGFDVNNQSGKQKAVNHENAIRERRGMTHRRTID
jgi:hypothetical protein